MNNSIQAINKLYNEKKRILEQVYVIKNLEEVYKRQTYLSTMAINIYSDAAKVMMPALIEDGLDVAAWTDISGKLGKLNFVGVPTAAAVRDAYRQAVEQASHNPQNEAYIIRPENEQQFSKTKPERGERFRATKKEEMPLPLKKIAAFGIAVPLVLELLGGRKFLVLVRILQGLSLGVMVIEIIRYLNAIKNFKLFENLKAAVHGKTQNNNPVRRADNGIGIPGPLKQPEPVDYEMMYMDAINQVKEDNMNELKRWFRELKRLTQMELLKVKGEQEV